MKALGLRSRPALGGTASQFTWVDAPKGTPGKSQISLTVKAVALNIDDIHIAEGTAFGGIPLGLPKPSSEKPLILGMDVCGIIDAVGQEVTQFSVGDAVFGVIYPWSRVGGMAPYVCANAKQFHPLPKAWRFAQGAAMGVSAGTACATLKLLGEITNKRCIVVGASGGIGSLIVQALSMSGAKEVIGVCSEANAGHVLSLGADRVVDYTKGPWAEQLSQYRQDVDCVIDCIGGKDTEFEALALLKKTGHFVTLCGPVRFFGDQKTPLGSLIKIYGYLIRRLLFSRIWGPKYTLTYGTLPDWSRIQRDFIDKDIKPQIDSLHDYTAEGVQEAFEKLKSHRNRGKIILNAQICDQDPYSGDHS